MRVLSDPTCTRCGLHELTNRVCVPGDGPTTKKGVMILGEAPGRREEETGRPFMGAAGRLLRRTLEAVGLSPETCFIHNAVNCRPPDNRTPKKTEIKACRYWVQERIRALKPRFVLLLGNVPLISITGEGGIKKKRGRPFEEDGTIYFPTYHPAYILRDERSRPHFEADLRFFKEMVDRGSIPKEEGLDYTIVQTPGQFKEMLADLHGVVSRDVETTGLYPWEKGELKPNPLYPNAIRRRGIVSIGFGTKRRQWCWPIYHPGSAWLDSLPILPEMFAQVSRRLESCHIVGHNGKFDALWVKRFHKQDWRDDFDTMLAHYLIDENSRHDLKGLSQIYFGAPAYDEDVKLKTGERGTLEDHCKYLAHDLFYTRRLRFTLGAQLEADAGISKVFWHILMPCAVKYVDLEYHGVPIDVALMGKVENDLRATISSREAELRTFGDINWGSPKQVAELLFGKFKISPPQKTEKGAPSTSESALNQIDHPCVEALIKYRGARQQMSLFIEGWKPFLHKGRIHPSFKLHGTVTGRPSCVQPNLQQTARDSVIRSLVASTDPEWDIIEFDLSQIELRIAGELSGDQEILATFDRDEDIHWLTAIREIGRSGAYKEEVLRTAAKFLKLSSSRAVGKGYAEALDMVYKMGPEKAAELDSLWKEVRKKAKAVNFGYLYGMWWKKFIIYARDNYGVKVTPKQAQDSRKAFFFLYKALEGWHNRQRRFAQRNGYVRSLSGRKRRLPDAMLQDDSPKCGEAQRQAINSPVQSFASDLNLMVLLQLMDEFSLDDVQPLGTIHDAILLYVRKAMIPRVFKRGLEIMTHPKMLDELGIKLRVPIKGEGKIGPWGKGVSLEKWLASQPDKARSMPGVAANKNTTSSTSRSSIAKGRRGRLRSARSSTG